MKGLDWGVAVRVVWGIAGASTDVLQVSLLSATSLIFLFASLIGFVGWKRNLHFQLLQHFTHLIPGSISNNTHPLSFSLSLQLSLLAFSHNWSHLSDEY